MYLAVINHLNNFNPFELSYWTTTTAVPVTALLTNDSHRRLGRPIAKSSMLVMHFWQWRYFFSSRRFLQKLINPFRFLHITQH